MLINKKSKSYKMMKMSFYTISYGAAPVWPLSLFANEYYYWFKELAKQQRQQEKAATFYLRYSTSNPIGDLK